MKKRLSAMLFALALCAALPLSVFADVNNVTYSSNGNVRVTGSGNPGENFIVGVYDTAGVVQAIGNASVDASGNYDMTIITGIQQGSSAATFEVRAYSQDNPNVAPAAGDVKALNVPRSSGGSGGSSGGGSSSNTNNTNTTNNNNNNNNNNDGGYGSDSFYDNYYGDDNTVLNDNAGFVPPDGGEFIGADYTPVESDSAESVSINKSATPRGVVNFGRAPQTGVFDIVWAVTGMFTCFVASAAMWYYVLRRKRIGHRRCKNGRAQAL